MKWSGIITCNMGTLKREHYTHTRNSNFNNIYCKAKEGRNIYTHAQILQLLVI